jgi:Flp pilus assembly protein TadD
MAAWSVTLIALTVGAYSRVSTFEFTNFDDPDYVVQNNIVHRGVTLEGVKWAFSTGFMGNWHPLTWVSHMLDCQLFGLDAGAHHLTSVAIHCLNGVLLLWVLFRFTGALERSAFVAGLFALHPLHVESVAWISERKDVLSMLFWLLTMWSYLRYVERRSAWRYLAVMLWFVLGLMCKPMLVTLPFVLLLLDYWPLGRARTPLEWRRVIIEKTPLFILTVASCVITFAVQKQGGAIGSMEKFSWGTRIGTALIGYVAYVGKTLLPDNLAVFYPHPGAWPLWQVAGAAIVITLITAVALALTRCAPYLIVGWLWFVGTLVPVSGVVQVGEQAYADRYSYIPLIGFFMAIVWGIADVTLRFRWPIRAVRVLGILGLGVCAVMTTAQVRHWRNSEILFGHAIRVTENNHVAHYNLGQALTMEGRHMEAMEHYLAAVAIKPDYDLAHNNLGVAYVAKGEMGLAAYHYQEALRLNPTNCEMRFNVAVVQSRLGQLTNALEHLRYVVEQQPANALVHKELADVLVRIAKPHDAVTHYREAVRLNPALPEALNGFAWLLATNPEDGIRNGREAVKLALRACELTKNQRPDFLGTLAAAHAEAGDFSRAVDAAEKAEGLARSLGDRVGAEKHRARLEGYRKDKPYRELP